MHGEQGGGGALRRASREWCRGRSGRIRLVQAHHSDAIRARMGQERIADRVFHFYAGRAEMGRVGGGTEPGEAPRWIIARQHRRPAHRIGNDGGIVFLCALAYTPDRSGSNIGTSPVRPMPCGRGLARERSAPFAGPAPVRAEACRPACTGSRTEGVDGASPGAIEVCAVMPGPGPVQRSTAPAGYDGMRVRHDGARSPGQEDGLVTNAGNTP